MVYEPESEMCPKFYEHPCVYAQTPKCGEWCFYWFSKYVPPEEREKIRNRPGRLIETGGDE